MAAPRPQFFVARFFCFVFLAALEAADEAWQAALLPGTASREALRRWTRHCFSGVLHRLLATAAARHAHLKSIAAAAPSPVCVVLESQRDDTYPRASRHLLDSLVVARTRAGAHAGWCAR